MRPRMSIWTYQCSLLVFLSACSYHDVSGPVTGVRPVSWTGLTAFCCDHPLGEKPAKKLSGA